MRPQVVENTWFPLTASARFATRTITGTRLMLRQLLHTAVGSQDSQDSSSAEVSSQHLLQRRGSRLAHHKCLVDLGKLQDSRRDDYNYAMSRHAVHALVYRRRFSSWSDAIRRLHPVSLASELASHNTSADCVLFDPDAFKSWSPTHTTCSHNAAQLARICKLQSDSTPVCSQTTFDQRETSLKQVDTIPNKAAI